MKKHRTYLFTFAIVLIIVAAGPGPSSSGAPASHTGAPGEGTCGVSGCHDDNTINKGTASLQIEFGENISQYKAGETYKLKIRISDVHKTRFGFQVMAMDEKGKKSYGSFKITDSLRTQIVKNMYTLKEREYVTYTFNGTDAVQKGLSEWTVNWIAPEKIYGPVTFYAAAVSANDDMTDRGDKVYTGSLTINK